MKKGVSSQEHTFGDAEVTADEHVHALGHHLSCPVYICLDGRCPAPQAAPLALALPADHNFLLSLPSTLHEDNPACHTIQARVLLEHSYPCSMCNRQPVA